MGPFPGAVVCWLACKQHFDDEPEAAGALGIVARAVPIIVTAAS